MIINNFNVPSILPIPPEANSEPVVDTHAPLACSIGFSFFQPVAGRIAQIFDGAGKIEGLQAPRGNAGDTRPAPAGSGEIDSPGFLAGERLDHA